MASIFKRTNRNGKKSKKYLIEYKDEYGEWRTVAGCTDIDSSRKLAAKLESDATLRRSGAVVEDDLDAPIPIDAYRTHLEAKGDTPLHTKETISQIESICAACGFSALGDLRTHVAAERVNGYLGSKKKEPKRKKTEELTRKVVYAEPEALTPISARTRNKYIGSLKSFCKWCIVTGKMPDCRLVYSLERAKESDDTPRRPATGDEMRRILKAAKDGGADSGLSGESRYYLYRVATSTGFRASELRSLCPSDFKLSGPLPHIKLAAKDAKNNKKADQPIRPEFAAELAKWLRGKAANEPVWPGTWNEKAAEMLRVDLKAADVPYAVDGLVLDFHALRATFITSLAQAGVHPRTAQILARHSNINLTMNYYTLLSLSEVAAALPIGVSESAVNAQ